MCEPLMQGVSTTLYAATAPQLEGQGGAYLVDCAVAQPSKTCQDMDTVRFCPPGSATARALLIRCVCLWCDNDVRCPGVWSGGGNT